MNTYRVKQINAIRLTKKFSIHLPREALLKIYKSFVRSNLDCGDTIFDKPNNHSKVESKVFNIKHV